MKLTRSKALRRIEDAREQIASLRETSANSPRFQFWSLETLRLITKIFPQTSSWEREFRALSFGLLFDTRHQAGGETEETYRECLAKAESILAGLEEAFHQPQSPPGADLDMDVEQANTEAHKVLVLHGPEDSLVARITPVILAAQLSRVAIPAWPADAAELERRLRERGAARSVLVALNEGDLGPPPDKPNVAPAIPAPVSQAVRVAVKVHGAARVRVIVLSRIALPAESFPVPIVPLDARGGWRKALNHAFAAPPAPPETV
jgi:hypothetical protein